MSRKTARATAKTALEETGLFQQVYTGVQKTFDQQSPVAVITSAGMALEEDARELYTLIGSIQVSVYVRHDVGAEAAEDQLDDLVEATMTALRDAGLFIDPSNAAAEGAPLRSIDGALYRVERIPLRENDYREDE